MSVSLKTSPIFVWFASLLTFILINIGLKFFFESQDGYTLQVVLNKPFDKRITSSLLDLKRAKKLRRDEAFYAVIGSSLTRSGVWCNDEFSQRYREAKKKINIYPFYWTGHQLKFFNDYYNLFYQLIDLEVDGVFLESDLLYYKLVRRESKVQHAIVRHQMYLKSLK